MAAHPQAAPSPHFLHTTAPTPTWSGSPTTKVLLPGPQSSLTSAYWAALVSCRGVGLGMELELR